MLLNKRVALPLLLSFISLTVLSVSHGAPYDLAVQVAREQIGKPYTDLRPDNKGPDAFDCSGLTEYVYRHVGLEISGGVRGHLGVGTEVVNRRDYEGSDQRISEQEARAIASNLRLGDILFFANSSADARNQIKGHVGMFTGGTSFINSYWPEDVQEVDLATTTKPARNEDGSLKEGSYYLRDIFVSANRPPAPIGPSTKFAVNDIVEVTADGYCIRDVTRYWDCPTSPKTKKGVQGNVLSRPMIYNGLWYWHMELESGAEGWVAEDLLKPIGGGGGSPMRVEDVPFEDENLRQCVGSLSMTVDQVTSVRCGWSQDAQITSLEGMQYFTKLEVLHITGGPFGIPGKIRDISPIKGLVELKELDLNTNDVDDIEPLRALNKLRYLNLNNNNVSNIDPLFSLGSLESVHLSWNDNIICEELGRLENERPALYIEWPLHCIIGSCGPTSNQVGATACATSLSETSAGLCEVGKVEDFSYDASYNGGQGIWNWLCVPEYYNDWSSSTGCSKNRCPEGVDGDCGDPSSGASCSTMLNSTSFSLCDPGAVTNFRLSSGQWLWTCVGTGDGASASCSEQKCATPTMVNGVCGSLVADGRCSTNLTASSPGLCSKGTVGNFASVSTLYAWYCRGSNGGTDTLCKDDRCP